MQQLPPSCGARQLSKLKRFLTTLQQFASDISPQTGLHNNHVTVEEFHNQLQQATNFPMRPFIIPFLKTTLPLLQRELVHCSQIAKQSPHLYFIHSHPQNAPSGDVTAQSSSEHRQDVEKERREDEQNDSDVHITDA